MYASELYQIRTPRERTLDHEGPRGVILPVKITNSVSPFAQIREVILSIIYPVYAYDITTRRHVASPRREAKKKGQVHAPRKRAAT